MDDKQWLENTCRTLSALYKEAAARNQPELSATLKAAGQATYDVLVMYDYEAMAALGDAALAARLAAQGK